MQDAHKFEYSDPTKIENLVKNYSQFISFPIYTWQEKIRSEKVAYLLYVLGVKVCMVHSEDQVFLWSVMKFVL
jgi:HSP90 family molecular chaperone